MTSERRGVISFFVRHPTAANLVMILLVVAGALALARMNVQFFPKVDIDRISITVPWPGASAEDVDSNIVAAIDPEVRFLNGVKRVSSISTEGMGQLWVELEPGADNDSVFAAVETAVGAVDTLPESSEKPTVAQRYSYEMIGRLVVSGPFSEAALRAYAKDIRQRLLDRGVDKVDLFGSRREEILVEPDPRALRQLDLTLDDIARRIGESALDLPSGTVPAGTEKQIRSLGAASSAEALGDIEIVARQDGAILRLRDIATIEEAFDERDASALRKGRPAVEVVVRRALSSDALEQAALFEEFLEEHVPTLPPSLSVRHYDDATEAIDDRIGMLLRNGATGLALVVIVLFVFLSARVAFWIAVGIPVSLFATFAVMMLSGQTIDMVSLFGLILGIGIIVDDAIVVGEHATTRRMAGVGPAQAAEQGARRMLAPVLAATLTTIAAFLPLLMVSDVIGQIMRAIPLVIVAVLVASLLECFLVLPRHMRGSLRADPRGSNRFARWFNPRFEAFRDGPFARIVRACVAWRYFTMGIAVALLILPFGLMAGGRIAFVFFPSPEADTVYANVSFVEGTGRETTAAMVGELERALEEAEAALTGGAGGVVAMYRGQVGAPATRFDAFAVGAGDHVGGLVVELVPSDSRSVRTQALIEAWRARVRPMPGVDTFTILEQRAGPPGRELDIRVTGDDLEALKRAANEVRALLVRFPGVSDVADDAPYGKQETILQVTPRGHALGFTPESAARQIRAAFEGAIAKRIARGDEEVTIRVRLPRGALTEADLRHAMLRSPAGLEVPLAEVVAFTERTGFAAVRREDGARSIAVTGELDESVITSDEIIAALQGGELSAVAQRHDVRIAFRGKAEEQATTLGDMTVGAVIGLVAIYLVLAWVFGSYAAPFFVMSVIPFGVVGAVLGHLVMGYDLTVLSVMALLGLAGIVVNNAIVLVRAIQERREAGEAAMEALVGGARDRLRAVTLTSTTTIFALFPLLFETSLQAQFLKPMAVTIVFGLLGATLMVLILVPCLLAIQSDLLGLFSRSRAARRYDVAHPPALEEERP